jgi:hypothetical protein
MSPDELRNKVVEAFDSVSLLKSLELDASSFRELPRLFESSHLSMRITLNDQAAMAVASSIAANLKRCLQQSGIELEYSITSQWKISRFSPAVLQGREGSGMPSERFDLDLQSGSVKRLVSIRVCPEAIREIRRYLSDVSPADQPSAIFQLLETWLRQQLESNGLEHWDPVLYPARIVQAQDIVELIPIHKQSVLQPQLG